MKNLIERFGKLCRVCLLFSAFFVLPIFIHASQSTKMVTVCDGVDDPLTLDPHKQFTEKNLTILSQIYQGLLSLDRDGKLQPELATSWERLSPLTVRFKLRDHVVFHDGEPFDANVVKLNFDRLFNPSTGFPAIGFILSISSVTVVDDHTIDITTKFPDGILLNRLASVVLFVSPKAASREGEGALSHAPVGTGPFEFSQWKHGEQIILKANRNYWKKGYPKVGGLVFKFLPPEEQVSSLMKGQVDVVTEMPGTRTLEAKENSKTDVIKKETFYTIVGHFNTSRPGVQDIRVRKAINMGIDREELIRYDLLGNGNVLASITMPGETGHNPLLKPYPFDIEKAKLLLRQAGYPNGLHLKTLCRIHGLRTARIIAKQLERIGVYLDLKVIPDTDIMSSLKNDKWDMGIAGLPDIMAHSYFIQSIILYSKSPYSMHHDPVYDQKLEGMASEIDPLKQDALGKSLDEYVYNEALCVFTYQRIRTYGVSRRVLFSPPITGMPNFETLSLDW